MAQRPQRRRRPAKRVGRERRRDLRIRRRKRSAAAVGATRIASAPADAARAPALAPAPVRATAARRAGRAAARRSARVSVTDDRLAAVEAAAAVASAAAAADRDPAAPARREEGVISAPGPLPCRHSHSVPRAHHRRSARRFLCPPSHFSRLHSPRFRSCPPPRPSSTGPTRSPPLLCRSTQSTFIHLVFDRDFAEVNQNVFKYVIKLIVIASGATPWR